MLVANNEQRDLERAYVNALKEANQEKVRQLVSIIAITLAIICFVLVGVSLAFGRQLDNS
jgi:uncharacterized membrane protein